MKTKKKQQIIQLIENTILDQKQNLLDFDNGGDTDMEDIAYSYYLALDKIKEILISKGGNK